MGHYSIASQMFDSLELENKFIFLPMKPLEREISKILNSP
jgi:hypothetical protein